MRAMQAAIWWVTYKIYHDHDHLSKTGSVSSADWASIGLVSEFTSQSLSSHERQSPATLSVDMSKNGEGVEQLGVCQARPTNFDMAVMNTA